MLGLPHRLYADVLDRMSDLFRGIGMGHLAKQAATAQLSPTLAGRLYLSSSGWLLLSVPNALLRGLFDALDERGVELPARADGTVRGHISVASAEELRAAGVDPDRITERGHSFSYNLGPVKRVRPRSWDGVGQVWFVHVTSRELQDLRKSYGLSALPKDDTQPFHITFAIRKTGVLSADGDAKKATADKEHPDVFIIEGNPGPTGQHPQEYRNFYDAVANHVRSRGFTAGFDPGLEYTVPPGGRFWIGHSRGGSRLRLAPTGVSTLRLDDFEPEETRRAQDEAYAKLFKQLGVSTIADVPWELRPKSGPEHHTFSDEMKAAIDRMLGVKKEANELLPLRERADIYPLRRGRILTGLLSDGRPSLFGGGVDQGEDPSQAAARELQEETGYRVDNVRPAGVPPVEVIWPEVDESRLSEEQRERRRRYRGSRSSFFVGDVIGRRTSATDPSHFRQIRFRTPERLLRVLQAVKEKNQWDNTHIQFLTGMQAKKAEVIAHVAGPSGSGKSTLLERLKKQHPGLAGEDLDRFDDEAMEQLHAEGVIPREFNKFKWSGLPQGQVDGYLASLAQRRQKLTDEWLASQSGPAILAGHHWEGPHVLDFPAKHRLLLATGPLRSAWRAYRRSQGEEPAHRRRFSELLGDWREARQDRTRLTDMGYQPMPPAGIEKLVARELTTRS